MPKKAPTRKGRQKTVQNTTAVKDWWKFSPNILDARLVIERAKHKFTNDDAIELSEALWEWSKKDTSLFMEDFLNPIGMTRQRYVYLVKKFPDLKSMYELINQRLGARQRYFALVGKIDAGMTQKTLRNHLEDWRPVELYKDEWDREDRHRLENYERDLEKIRTRAAEAEQDLELFKKKLFELNRLGVVSDEVKDT